MVNATRISKTMAFSNVLKSIAMQWFLPSDLIRCKITEISIASNACIISIETISALHVKIRAHLEKEGSLDCKGSTHYIQASTESVRPFGWLALAGDLSRGIFRYSNQ